MEIKMREPDKYDIISTCHDDYLFEEDFQEEIMEKPLDEISLYQLMAEGRYIWLDKNKKFGFDFEIHDEDSPYTKYCEKEIHPCAIEGLASFCRRFLNS